MNKKILFSIVIALAPYRDAEVLNSINNMNFDKSKYEVIIKKGTNPSRNRNEGIKAAKGKIIAFIDDDAIVDKDLLKNVENFFNKYSDIDILGGPQLTPSSDKFFAKLTGAAIESFFSSYKMSNRYKKNKLNLNANELSLTSANCFVKSEVFKKIDGFNENLWPGEDPEFFTRAKNSGFKITYSPEIIIYHRRRSNLSGFFKQFFSYGATRLKKERLNKTKINIVMLIPSFFVLYIISLPLIYKISPLFLIPLIVYLVINIIFSIFISLKRNILYLPFLPFIFFIVHFSYGLGMISSLFEK